MDARGFIFGVLGLASIIGAAVLYAIGEPDGAQAMVAFAMTATGYILGLYSDPFVDVDES